MAADMLAILSGGASKLSQGGKDTRGGSICAVISTQMIRFRGEIIILL